MTPDLIRRLGMTEGRLETEGFPDEAQEEIDEPGIQEEAQEISGSPEEAPGEPKKVLDHEICWLGLMPKTTHPHYGKAPEGSPWTSIGLGLGRSPGEAFLDAIDTLRCWGWDPSAIPMPPTAKREPGNLKEEDLKGIQDGSLLFFVTISVR
jgi:hypothetical protein